MKYGGIIELARARFAGIERFTRTDLKYFLVGGSWLFSGQVVGMLTSMILAIGYAHFLPKEVYGTYKYIIAIFGIFSVFTLSGMEGAATKSISQGKDGAFWVTFRYRIIGGIVGAAFCLLAALYYYLRENVFLATIFFVSSPFLVGLDPSAHYGAILQGKKLFRLSSLINMTLQVIAALLLFATIVNTDSVTLLVISYLVINIVVRTFAFYYVLRTAPLNQVPDPSAPSFGVHYSITAMLGIVASKLDAVLLWYFLGPVQLAIYSFAKAFTDNIQNSFKLITTTLAFPKLAAQDKEVTKKTLGRKTLLAMTITVPLSILLALLIPYVYRFVFPQYVESVIYAQVLMLLLAFSPLRFISTAIVALAPPKILYVSGAVSTFLLSILLFIFVPIFGVWGVLISMAIQQFMVNGLNLFLFRQM